MSRPFEVAFCERVVNLLTDWISYSDAEARVVAKRLKQWRKELKWAQRKARKTTP